MQTLGLRADRQGLKAALEKAAALRAQLVLVFAPAALWQDKAAVTEACAVLQGANVIGCSADIVMGRATDIVMGRATAGEMSSDNPNGSFIADESISILAMRFENTQVKVAKAAIASPEGSRGAGLSVAEDLRSPALRGIFAFCPGSELNGSAFVRAVASVVGPKVVIAGGMAGGAAVSMAGDGLATPKSTFTMLNGTVYPNTAVAFGLYGDHVTVRTGARSGWRPFGLARRVTKAAGNVLFELDGLPALGLFETYLGEKAAGLPRSGLAYPFAVLRDDDRRETGVIRTLLGIDRLAGSLILAGDLAQDSLVRLMHADVDLLAESAALAAADAKITDTASSATLLVSCAGRRLVMGAEAGREAEAAAAALGAGAGFAGFYGTGAFGAPSGTNVRELLNQTLLVAHIAETAAPAGKAGP